MNWLAHVFLSPPQIEFRLGNLLADLVKGKERAGMPERFQEGIKQHQAIDRFTDTHLIVSRSRSRIIGDFPHATGILMDIFYDHFLAIDWKRYAKGSLESFTQMFYSQMQSHSILLPEHARHAIEYILREDQLGAYQRLDGIEMALRRLSIRLEQRIGKNLRLERGMDELVANYDDLRGDFAEFFPQLQSHIRDFESASRQVGES